MGFAVVASLALAACGPRHGQGAGGGTIGPKTYLPPPSVTAATAAGAGVTLTGKATAGLRVRLGTPDGVAVFAPTDSHGVWRLSLAASPAVRLFGLSMADAAGARTVQAEGYLAVTPQGRVAQLRSGSGALDISPRPAPLAILAVDYDRKGGSVVSGEASPASSVTIRVDGVQRGQANADANGRFSIGLSDALAPGEHEVEAADGELRVLTVATMTPAPILTQGPFRAERSASGWRIDWMTPGGGVQTTLLIDSLEPAA